jgi:hypothetical protein
MRLSKSPSLLYPFSPLSPPFGAGQPLAKRSKERAASLKPVRQEPAGSPLWGNRSGLLRRTGRPGRNRPVPTGPVRPFGVTGPDRVLVFNQWVKNRLSKARAATPYGVAFVVSYPLPLTPLG